MGVWSSRNSVKKLDKPNAASNAAIGTAASSSAIRETATTLEDSDRLPSVSARAATNHQGSGTFPLVSAADQHVGMQNTYSELAPPSGQSLPGITASTSSAVLPDESMGLREDVANEMQLPPTKNCLVEENELQQRREAGKQETLVEKDKINMGMGVSEPWQTDQADPTSTRSSPSVQSVDETSKDPTASVLLVAAVENEDWAEADRLLRSPQPLDPNARTGDWGYALLRAAAEEGALGTCRLLLERRASVNARDQNGMTPLMGCIVGGDHRELVALLLEAAADAAAATDDNFTALKWATRLNREGAIILLRESGMTGSTTCF